MYVIELRCLLVHLLITSVLQEYSEKQLHTQLQYLKSLVDVEAFNSKTKKNTAGAAIPTGVTLQDNQAEIYKLLNAHITNTINVSAYNWIRPSLWSAMFQHKNADNSKISK